jgi:multiple sugar transport system permease protein
MSARRLVGTYTGRVALAAVLLLWLFPVYWLVLTAFKLKVDIQSTDPIWIVAPVLDNFIWLQQNFTFDPLKHSLVVVFLSVGIATLLGAPMAYALARFPFKQRDDVEFWVISTRMLPPEALIIPYYVIMIHINTITGLTIIYSAMNLPVIVWILLAFYRMMPAATEEAARIDGCSLWSAYFRIVIPMSASSIVAAALIIWIMTWNEFFFSFVLTSSNTTLPVEVASFLANGFNPQYGPMAAAGLILTIPPLLIAFFGRQYLIRGIQGLAGGEAR